MILSWKKMMETMVPLCSGLLKAFEDRGHNAVYMMPFTDRSIHMSLDEGCRVTYFQVYPKRPTG